MKPLPFSQLRAIHVVQGRPLDAATEAYLRADPRPSAQSLLRIILQRRAANRAEGQRLRKMLRFETALWTSGVHRVAGIDEAGMAPLAGPVAAAAVVFKPGTRIAEVDDSKKLDAADRTRLAALIKSKAAAWCVAFVGPDEIDTINIYWAGLLAMQRAVEGLGCAPEHLLIDARRLKELPIAQQAIVKGDAKSLSIAAASILAKTARDEAMCRFDIEHPGYGFAQHKGYGVSAHLDALKRLGACAIHRRSFAPVREVMGLPPLPPWPKRADAPAGEENVAGPVQTEVRKKKGPSAQQR